jgi:hypothetical protein
MRASIEIGRFLCNFLVFFRWLCEIFSSPFCIMKFNVENMKKNFVKGGGLKNLSFLEVSWG